MKHTHCIIKLNDGTEKVLYKPLARRLEQLKRGKIVDVKKQVAKKDLADKQVKNLKNK